LDNIFNFCWKKKLIILIIFFIFLFLFIFSFIHVLFMLFSFFSIRHCRTVFNEFHEHAQLLGPVRVTDATLLDSNLSPTGLEQARVLSFLTPSLNVDLIGKNKSHDELLLFLLFLVYSIFFFLLYF